MKYLIIFIILLSNSLQANIRVEVENNISGRKFGAEFETQAEADTWKQNQIDKKSWGKPDRWERREDQDTCPGLERLQGDAVEGFYYECFYPVEYTITETDITAEVTARQAKRDACQVLEVKLKTPADLTLAEMNDYLRCK